MPANKYALLRYRVIDRCIRSKGKPYPGKEDLRSACEEAIYGSDGERISISTIDKDLWAMRNEGELGYYAPIKYDKTESGYYYEDPNFSIAEIPLNEDDLQSINIAAQTLYQFRDIPIFEQFGSAIQKIMDRMRITTAEQADKAQHIIQFESSPSNSGSEFLEAIFNAISDGKVISFDYQKFQAAKAKHYEILPFVLKEYRNRWYVLGQSLDKNRVVTFGLERIQTLKVLDRRVEKTVDFDVDQFFKHAIGITVTNEPPVLVKLEIESSFAPYIITQPIHSSQQVIEEREDAVLISLHVQPTIELISIVLGFADKVTVVSPEKLKEDVKGVLTKCLSGLAN